MGPSLNKGKAGHVNGKQLPAMPGRSQYPKLFKFGGDPDEKCHRSGRQQQVRPLPPCTLLTTPMSSTHAYTALSPDYADLAQPQSSRQVKPPLNSPSQLLKRWPKLHHAAGVMRDLYARNTGLLLVLPSQLFFSLMNVAVKKLNNIDPPVSALQVCSGLFSIMMLSLISFDFSSL